MSVTDHEHEDAYAAEPHDGAAEAGASGPPVELGPPGGCGVWTPETAEVTDHRGDPIPSDMEFFDAPPAEIGPVISAVSSLTPNKQPMGFGARVCVAAIPLVIALGVGAWILTLNGAKDDLQFFAGIVGVIGMIVAGVVFGVLGFSHQQSFVGEFGFSIHHLRGSRENQPRVVKVEFKDAVDLRTGETRQYVNGVYTGTQYEFKWTDENGKMVHKLFGSYRAGSDDLPKKATDPYLLGRSAEISWSTLLADAMQEELEQSGAVHFNVNKKLWVKVGPGFLEFGKKGQVERIEVDQIASVQISNGWFEIKSQDAGWFSSKGKFQFQYSEMANARLFLLALDRLCGFRFE